MSHLLLATTNPGKVTEIQQILDGLPITLVTLEILAGVPEPEETGSTFAENAAIKARAYAAASGLPTVAEDSGLAIDALGGRPGVLSARYPGATYAERFRNLYAELVPFPRPWTARFVCSLVFIAEPRAAAPQPIAFAHEANVEGEISTRPEGDGGFGYDPIFLYPPYGTTLANVSTERKLAVAHRGRAFRAFRSWLEARQ